MRPDTQLSYMIDVSLTVEFSLHVLRGDYRSAQASAGDLIGLYRSVGRLPEALLLAEQQIDYPKRAGLGPWTQLPSHVRWLQVQKR